MISRPSRKNVPKQLCFVKVTFWDIRMCGRWFLGHSKDFDFSTEFGIFVISTNFSHVDLYMDRTIQIFSYVGLYMDRTILYWAINGSYDPYFLPSWKYTAHWFFIFPGNIEHLFQWQVLLHVDQVCLRNALDETSVECKAQQIKNIVPIFHIPQSAKCKTINPSPKSKRHLFSQSELIQS